MGGGTHPLSSGKQKVEVTVLHTLSRFAPKIRQNACRVCTHGVILCRNHTGKDETIQQMSHNLLKGKRGIIFGALNAESIAWKVARSVS